MDASKPHRCLKEFSRSTLLRRDVYERVKSRWGELGFSGAVPGFPAFDEGGNGP